MHVVKLVLLVIVSLIVVLLISGLFMAKDYSIERELVINKPKQQVFDYIRFIRNQDNYSKWNMADSNMKKEYTGTDGAVGFIYRWDSKKMGKGAQEVVKITDGERIDMNLHFIKPMNSEATTYMATEAVGANQTKVKWGMSGHSSYPMNIMQTLMQSMLQRDVETSLGNLKEVLEKQ